MMKRLALILVSALVLFVAGYWVYAQQQSPAFAVSQVGTETQTSALISSTPSATNQPTRTPFQPETHTLTSTLTPTQTSTPTSSSTPTPTSTPTPLDEARIQGISGRWAAYSLDCESRSAVDWAGYFGVQINEITFFNALPVSDDPDLGFVGNVHAPWGQTPPKPYGVHAGPVAALLQEYNLNAVAVRGMTWDQLRNELSQDRPVIVWVVGRVGRGTPIPYTSLAGNETVVARFEHTVIAIGYTENEITVLDGNWVYSRSKTDFLNSWGVLGNMAIVLED